MRAIDDGPGPDRLTPSWDEIRRLAQGAGGAVDAPAQNGGG